MQPRRPVLRYGAALAVVAATAVLVMAIHAVAGEQTPVYLLFTAAVTLAAGFGGLGPGLVATGASVGVMSAWLALGAPVGFIVLAGRAYLGLFIAVCLLIGAVSELLRTGYRRAEDLRATADAGRARLALLAEAGALLADATDIRKGLDAVARVAIPRMGDWCAIHLADEAGAVSLAAAAHFRREREEAIWRLNHAYPTDSSGVNPLQRALSSGKADLRQDIEPGVLVETARDPQHLQDLRDLGFRSYICAPLVARERTLGVILLVKSGRLPYTSEDVTVASSLARRIALAVDNARLLKAAEQEVAERRRAEIALRSSQARLSGIIAEAMDAIIGVDARGRIVVFNRAAEAMFLCGADEALGLPIARFIPEDPGPAAKGRAGNGTRGGPGSGTPAAAVEGVRANGERFPIEATVSHAEQGGEGLQTFIIRDVTERRRSEAEIGELNDRLRQAMTETHHRVKNNLQVIAAMIDLRLLDGEPTVPAAEWRRLGDYVRALAMLHDVLTHDSRAVGATMVVRSRTVISRILALLEEGLAHSVELTHTIDDVPLTARQGTSLAIVVSELVGNAVKHGGGQVHVALRAVDGVALLTVRDRGPGFPPNFDVVSEAHTGLELVHNLSQWDLGGHATFGAAPGGGGLVTIDIRIDPTVAASDAEGRSTEEGRANGPAE